MDKKKDNNELFHYIYHDGSEDHKPQHKTRDPLEANLNEKKTSSHTHRHEEMRPHRHSGNMVVFLDVYDHDHDHDHSHDDDDHHHDHHHEQPLEENGLWVMDNFELMSVGIDIGSSGSQVIFSRLGLKRMGEDLSSRYVVVSREPVYMSPVELTPYRDEESIDEKLLARIIDDAYHNAGLSPERIDTGVVLLTGEAIRRHNAQPIADILAERGGEFVCAAAGHNMEALLAAYGSGAVYASFERNQRILNIDIGGGTTKLAIVENGKVLETAALHIGGRLAVINDQWQLQRLDPAGKDLASRIGCDWNLRDQVGEEELVRLTAWMANAVIEAVSGEALAPEIESLMLTPHLQELRGIDGVMFSGGVGEYVYDREERDFGDLGKRLGAALRSRIEGGSFPWPVLPAGECIRATVIGASQYSLQVSGNTNYISDQKLLPYKNLQVIHPEIEFGEQVDPGQVAQAICEHLERFDVKEGEANIALAFHWTGVPAYERIFGLASGICQAMVKTIASGKPLIVVLDGDIARNLGRMLQMELQVAGPILSIDGIMLQNFDYIDIGRMLFPSETVPVTVKSLVFQM
ncbi:ethanolamine ammonia-lyase reactivating factor EutA [Paenibacillus thalictri]|nr:ethanolamine ammonia-lyase reactivating factor EutA [Paenibacillus thalictri]